MSDVYDDIWEKRKHKPPKREEQKLPDANMPRTDYDRLKDSIERRKKRYGLK